MPKHSEFVAWLTEELAPAGHIRARAMFGGYGLYVNELFTGIVIDDVLYLKADDINRARFLTEGCEPFAYQTKQGKTVRLSFYETPSAALDNPDDLIDWVRGSAQAALRAKT